MLKAAIHNPVVPCTWDIPDGSLTPGLIFIISGHVHSKTQGFAINFCCGPYRDDQRPPDIAFHFNPRLNKKYVARNSLINNVWGDEQSQQPTKKFPFNYNDPFEIMVLVEARQYKVAVNGVHFIDYDHRLPIQTVSVLNVIGGVDLSKIELRHADLVSEYQQIPIVAKTEILNPAIPYYDVIPGGLHIGSAIFISGRPRPFAQSFAIDLQGADGVGSLTDAIFHFNPRFFEKKTVIVRNSNVNGIWGPEERDAPCFPFELGASFDLVIMCEQKEFLVAVNGQHLFGYRHRIPISRATHMEITGDVDVNVIRF